MLLEQCTFPTWSWSIFDRKFFQIINGTSQIIWSWSVCISRGQNLQKKTVETEPGSYKIFIWFVFVSPELSSGRDLVIQMSVRRAASAVRRPWFFVRSISREPYDLPWWYLVCGWVQVWSCACWILGVADTYKYLICIIYAKICPEHFSGTVYPTWMIFGMWVGLGPKVRYGDLDGGQWSSEVKWGKLCAMATIFGQKKPWCKLRMMMTFMEVKGHQRSNGVNYVLWLPYLVKRSPDASWEWWWPLWRSKVIRGQMW